MILSGNSKMQAYILKSIEEETIMYNCDPLSHGAVIFAIKV